MNKLTPQEKSALFSLYIGQELDEKTYEEIQILVGVTNNEVYCTYQGMYGNAPIEDFKLWLFTIESITKEHSINILKIIFNTNDIDIENNDNHRMTYYQIQNIAREFGDNKGKHTFELFTAISIYNYLIKEGYDMPVYMGVDHWANGKTLIELGIAKDKKYIFRP